MSLYGLTALSVFAGFGLDCLLGDPLSSAHPVVLMGKLISFLEKRLRARFPKTPQGERTAGRIMALCVPLISAGAGLLLLYFAWQVHPWAYFAVSAFLCWQCFAARCLMTEAKKVVTCLEKQGLSAGRCQVAMLVGRDTENLSEQQVVKAAVETVAENTSDGVAAPLFWMALFGAVGGLFYKAVNTMDSMVGYRNEKYLHFGRFAARLDDAVNYIPARLAALLLIAAAALTGMDAKNAWRIWRRDRRNHASPNSAQTESAAAGALRLRLAGDAVYFGQVHKKPFIGDDLRPIEPEDIRRSHRLLFASTGEMLLLAVIFRGLLALSLR
jgi:adenosylcobinamide-phosphate synthase